MRKTNRKYDKIDALLVNLKGPTSYNSVTQYEVPLGLLSIATHCENKGFKVLVLNEPNVTLDLLLKIIAIERIGVIGFHCNAENVWSVMSAIDILKKQNNSLLCIAGGPQVSASPWNARIIEQSQCDIAVEGEGEEAFADILAIVNNKFDNISAFESVNGITYRLKNKIVFNGRKSPSDLRCYPIPDRNLTYFPSAPTGAESIYTSRGCPYKCAFCFEATKGSMYRTRDVSAVLNEVELLLKERTLRHLSIVDDLFMFSGVRVKEICEGFKRLQNRYHDFSWYCEGRANIIRKNPELLDSMIDSGLVRLQIGIESGDQAILDNYNKHLTLDDLRETARFCLKSGLISVVGNFIIGGPFETWITISNSVAFAKELLEIAPGCIDIMSSTLAPYPGTAICLRPKKYGIDILDADSITGPGNEYVFLKTKELSKSDILAARAGFDQEVEKKAASLIPIISNDRAKKIFEARERFGIFTMWNRLFSLYRPNYFNYFGLQVTDGRIPFAKIPKKKLEDYKPLRTMPIIKFSNDLLVLNVNGTEMNFSALGTRIYELCSGKLTIRQITDILYAENARSIDRAVLAEYVRLTFEKLDEGKLLIFSLI